MLCPAGAELVGNMGMVADTAGDVPQPASVSLCVNLGLTAEVSRGETEKLLVRGLQGCSKASGIVCIVDGVLLTIGGIAARLEATEGCVSSSAMLSGTATGVLFAALPALLLLSGLSMPHLARMLLIFCTSVCVASRDKSV